MRREDASLRDFCLKSGSWCAGGLILEIIQLPTDTTPADKISHNTPVGAHALLTPQTADRGVRWSATTTHCSQNGEDDYERSPAFGHVHGKHWREYEMHNLPFVFDGNLFAVTF
jgi:hypothetical protein